MLQLGVLQTGAMVCARYKIEISGRTRCADERSTHSALAAATGSRLDSYRGLEFEAMQSALARTVRRNLGSDAPYEVRWGSSRSRTTLSAVLARDTEKLPSWLSLSFSLFVSL